MKILHIIPTLYPAGAERLVVDIVNELSKDHTVHICVLFPLNEEMILKNQLDSSINLIVLGKRKGFDFRIFLKLFQLIRAGKYTVVHSHLNAINYLLLTVIFYKAKYFHTVHNIADKESNGLFGSLSRKVLFNFLKVTPVAISRIIKETISKLYNVRYIPIVENGIAPKSVSLNKADVEAEIENYKIDNDTKIYLSISRISNQKNLPLLLNVFEQLNKDCVNAKLLHIGSYHDIEGENLFKELKTFVPDNVIFLGPKENVIDYIFFSDYLLLSSIYEGLPMTILEALSQKKIIISTNVGGIPDVIRDDFNGFLVNTLNVDDYKEKLLLVAKLSCDERKRIEGNAYKYFLDNYSIGNTAAKYLKEYNLSY